MTPISIRTDPETDAERARREAAWAALWRRLLDRNPDDAECADDQVDAAEAA